MNSLLKAARIAATLSAVLMSSGIAALSAAPAQAAPLAPQIDRPASVLLVDSRDHRRPFVAGRNNNHGQDQHRWRNHDHHDRNWGRHDRHHDNTNNWRRTRHWH